EARLYEVKTNVEYTAVLTEIETIKGQKAQTEEEILALMERQESLAGEIREAESRLKTRDEQGKREEAVVREKLAAVEKELAGVRGERTTLGGDHHPGRPRARREWGGATHDEPAHGADGRHRGPRCRRSRSPGPPPHRQRVRDELFPRPLVRAMGAWRLARHEPQARHQPGP